MTQQQQQQMFILVVQNTEGSISTITSAAELLLWTLPYSAVRTILNYTEAISNWRQASKLWIFFRAFCCRR